MQTSERRAVRQLAIARALSVTGSAAASIALSVSVYETTKSAVWLSATFLLTFGVAGFVHPLAGALADRYDRRRIMIMSDTAGALIWSLVVVLRAPAALLAAGFLAELASAPFKVASRAAVPNMVSSDNLSWANGVHTSAGNIGRLAGPAIGGALAGTVGVQAVFILNAVSFVCSAVLVSRIRAPFAQDHERLVEDGRTGTGFLAGFRAIVKDPPLRSLVIVWTILYLAIDIALVADLPLSQSLGWGDFGYGLMNAAFGAGALVGSLGSRSLSRRLEPWAVVVGTLGVGLGYGMTATAPVFAFVLAGQFIAAAADAVDEVGGTSIIQRRTPDDLRGRVFGAISASGLIANAVGFSFAGFLVEALGPRIVYGICGILAAATVFLLRPLFSCESRHAPADASVP
jgi:MFS family permease